MVVGTFSCGAVILGMLGLNSIASVVILGVLYGYFLGVCKYFDRAAKGSR